MMRKFFLFSFLILLVFLVQPGSAAPPDQAVHVIKWGTIAPENTVWGHITMQASKEMEERSGGRIKNIWYFGGVMGDEPDMIRKARINQLQGMALLTIGISKLLPELTSLSLPFLFNNYDEVDCVFAQVWPMVEEIADQKGYVVLGRADVGFSVFFTKDNLEDPKQLKKTKVWKWSGLDLPMEELAGWIFGMTNFVSLSLPDVLTALQTGMVDTVYATYYSAVALQWQTQFKYMTDVDALGGAYAPALLLIKKDIFNSMPPDLQKIVRETCDKHFTGLRLGLRKDEAQAKQELVKRGIKFTRIDPVLYDLGKKCMDLSIYDYYRKPEVDLGFLRTNVTKCLEDLHAAAANDLNIPQPTPEGIDKLVKVFTGMEERFFSHKVVNRILNARDQCVMKKEASPKSK